MTGSSRTDPYGSGTDQPNNTIADSSGSGNHLTKSSNVASTDFVKDSPENNFATLFPSRSGEGASGHTFTEGNLQFTSSTYNYNATGSTINIPTTGKWYMEVYVKTAGSSLSHDFGLGLQGVKTDSMAKQNPATATYGDSTIYVTRRDFASRIEKNLNNVLIADTYSYNAGDIVSIAYDADNGKVYYGLNNAFWAEDGGTDGNPSSGTNHSTTLTTGVEYFFILAQYSNAYVSVTNFGQDSSFAGNKTRQNNADANGIGDFFYAPPTDFLALCTANLPDLTISPAQSSQADDHFNTFLYTGTNATNRNLALNTFTPDWVWLKARSTSDNHVLVDSSRVTGTHLDSSAVYPNLHTNTTDGETSDSHPKIITNGVQVSGGLYDNNSVTFVVWNWKANGGSLTTNDASSTGVGTIDSVFQANTTSGFSIVTYTGTGSAGTIKHGLSVAPSLVIIKNRSGASVPNWVIGQDISGFTGQLYFDTGAFSTNSGSFNNTAPTTSVVSIGTDSTVNQSTATYVMYCFANVEGFSRVGAYTGNGSTDGPLVYTGFKPAFLLIKSTGSSSNGWYIYDNKRLNFGTLVDGQVYANLANGDDDGNRDLDFLSNGFRPRLTDTNVNASGTTFVYLAFAEQPFKFSRAK